MLLDTFLLRVLEVIYSSLSNEGASEYLYLMFHSIDFTFSFENSENIISTT